MTTPSPVAHTHGRYPIDQEGTSDESRRSLTVTLLGLPHSVTLARVVRAVVVAIVILASMVLPSGAADPSGVLDGLWFIEETGPGIGPNPYYASIHQNGDIVLAILLDPIGEWIYAVGTRTGSTVQGTVYSPDGEANGAFTITVTSPTTLTGQSSFGGLTTPLNGNKMF